MENNNIEYLKKYGNPDTFESDLKRLEHGEPVQYIVGNVDFYGYTFKVTKDTLIPRFETEELVNRTIKYIGKFFETQELNIIDLGTGTGCIGITLKKELPKSQVTLVDISEEAIKVAEDNKKINNTDVKIVKSNFFANLSDKYHVVISNPPYLTESDEIMDIVLKNEPHLALLADNEGYKCYEDILKDIKEHLIIPGMIAFEIGYTQGDKIKSMIENIYPYATISIEKDLQGKDRFIFAFIKQK